MLLVLTSHFSSNATYKALYDIIANEFPYAKELVDNAKDFSDIEDAVKAVSTLTRCMGSIDAQLQMEKGMRSGRSADVRVFKTEMKQILFGNGQRPDALGLDDETCLKLLVPDPARNIFISEE